MAGKEITVNLPTKFKPFLTTNCRYCIAYGGRAGGKTTSFSIIFLIKALQSKCKILCVREIQNSIKESVYQTLIDSMEMMGVSHLFDTTYDQITCKTTGSTFIFMGLFRNVEKVKSIPNINYVWANEADKISEESLKLLMPTIRAQDSKLFFELNPNLPDDPVYRRFIANTATDSLVIEVQYYDNPFVSDTLIKQKDEDYRTLSKSEADHIWLGKTRGYGGFVWVPPFTQFNIRDFQWHQIKNRVNIVMSIDPHQHYYPACIWMALIKTESGATYKWVFDEYPKYSTFNEYYSEIRKKIIFSGDLAELTREFKAIERDLPQKVLKRFIDSRFAKGVGSAGMWNRSEGLIEQWAKPENGGLRFVLPREGLIDAQRMVIKGDLNYNPNLPVTVFNEPTLFISPSCRNLIQSMKNHRLCEDSEKEDERYKDMSDALRLAYAGVNKWLWQEEKKEVFAQWPSSQGGANAWQEL